MIAPLEQKSDLGKAVLGIAKELLPKKCGIEGLRMKVTVPIIHCIYFECRDGHDDCTHKTKVLQSHL